MARPKQYHSSAVRVRSGTNRSKPCQIHHLTFQRGSQSGDLAEISFRRGRTDTVLRDIGNGIAAKRFVVAAPSMGFLAVGGTILSAMEKRATHVAGKN